MTASLFPPSLPITTISEPLFDDAGIDITMVRLDQIHEIISGNKLFKLWHYLQEASPNPNSRLVTYGGPWSNHLVATAYAAKLCGIKSKGIVRGEAPLQLSQTLLDCLEYGMELQFINRSAYATQCLTEGWSANDLYIPEGGYSLWGAQGAAMIAGLLPAADHYCLAAGTGTTVAGLCLGLYKKNILCVPAIKNMSDLETRINSLAPEYECTITIDNRFHFGGFAKYDPSLVSFMNEFYDKHHVPLDVVYTGKLMYTVSQLASEGAFPHGAKICCLHTGGLQGNRSLKGMLTYL